MSQVLLTKYPWAVNGQKLQMAVDFVKANNDGKVTEEAVKARYIVLKGQVKEVVTDSPADKAPKTAAPKAPKTADASKA